MKGVQNEYPESGLQLQHFFPSYSIMRTHKDPFIKPQRINPPQKCAGMTVVYCPWNRRTLAPCSMNESKGLPQTKLLST